MQSERITIIGEDNSLHLEAFPQRLGCTFEPISGRGASPSLGAESFKSVHQVLSGVDNTVPTIHMQE